MVRAQDTAAGDEPASPVMTTTLTPSDFAQAAGTSLVLHALASQLKPGLRLPVPTTVDGARALAAGGRALAAIHRDHHQLSDEELDGWAARAANLAALAAATAVTCRAEIHNREVYRGATVRVESPRPRRTAHGTEGAERLLWCQPDAMPMPPPFSRPTCTTCGCTEERPCRNQYGEHCERDVLNYRTNTSVCTACRRPS